MLVGFIVGKVYLKHIEVLMQELKTSDNKRLILLAKEKKKVHLRIHKDYNEMFKGAEKYLTTEENARFVKTIDDIITSMWD